MATSSWPPLVLVGDLLDADEVELVAAVERLGDALVPGLDHRRPRVGHGL